MWLPEKVLDNPDALMAYLNMQVIGKWTPCEEQPIELFETARSTSGAQKGAIVSCRSCPVIEECRMREDILSRYSCINTTSSLYVGGETPSRRAGRRSAWVKFHGAKPWWIPIDENKIPPETRADRAGWPTPKDGFIEQKMLTSKEYEEWSR